MRRLNRILLGLLCLGLAGLLFLRWQDREAPPPTQTAAAVETAATPEPTPVSETAPAPTPEPTETPAPTPEPEPTPEPTPFRAPRGYTEESYWLVSDLVYAYANDPETASATVQADLERLYAVDPALGSFWTKVMRLWMSVNTDFTANAGLLPDGLPEDNSLCIVVLGFQLESDGSMSPELEGRCETALRCAEKYPNALIAVTGGGTAWQNPSATEAGVMADWLIAHGIAPERIEREDKSRTTADNADFTCALLWSRHPEITSLAIVTSDYHLPLGVLLFQEQALMYEYETGALPFSVISNAAFETEGRYQPDSPMSQKSYVWSIANPHY